MRDYYYGEMSEQFNFIRVPKALITDEHFRGMSSQAKVLYSFLLDRMCLSAKFGWKDKHGRVYIIYTIEEIMSDMRCGNQKAIKLLNELERGYGLIERKRQGIGRPNLIYVKNFMRPLTPQNYDSRTDKLTFQACDYHDSGV